ncbi:ATP-dependent DNA helicase DinG [Shouchella clausii]|uniref:ATP-dependent DNA helicase DinG n=1 Tax=Shouchella clausii TaxID=79880 RepID=UPI000BA55073|nr:ATP-dependent DNA helicase DinG [Shouchella clausii]PAD11384.1 ATP-dependent helicase DinG [Shouchella clausii]
MSQSFVVIDLETTGNSPDQGARMIQIGAVKVEGCTITDRFSTFVDPCCSIPPFITELTGITDKDVEGAPVFREIATDLLAFMEGSSLVAHNVPFDKGFLEAQLETEGLRLPKCCQFDTVELSRVLLPTQESYKLSELSSSLDMDHDQPHRADSDAEITAELFIKLLHKLERLPLVTLQSLEQVAKGLKSDWDVLTRPLIQKKWMKVDEDEKEYDLFRQLALKRVAEEEENSESCDHKPFVEVEEELFSSSGAIARVFDSFEDRPGQKQMMKEVYAAFEEHAHALIEAGTGTGKTLAYLVPSAYFAYSQKKPVVLSTYTIPLQEQLLQRDLRLLASIVPFPLRTAVLKGRSHYLDLRKFEQALQQLENDSYDVCLTKAQLLVWLLETDYGDVEELNLTTGGRSFWPMVQSDPESDLGKYNPWFSRCFYHRSRRQAKKADLIITNHALLLTDVVQTHSILPSYSHAVIDEAHHFQEAASAYFGLTASFLSVSFAIQRIGDDHHEYGAIARLEALGEQMKQPLALSDAKEGLARFREDTDELFRMIHVFALDAQGSNATDVGRISYVYKSFSEEGSLWQAILECAMRLQLHGEQVLTTVKAAYQVVEEKVEEDYESRSLLADTQGAIAAFEETVQLLYELLLEYDDNYVYWIEVEPKGAKNATYLYAKPIEVSERLADQFFAKKKSVVLTSATLTVNQSFDYQIDRLGLVDFGVKTKQIESPFSYEQQAKLLIPHDIPDVRGPDDELFAQDIAIKIWRITEVMQRKALVLFTSYDMLKKVFYYVKDLNDEGKLALIGQGVTSGSRMRLLKFFKQAEQRAVLFGTNSFWEGIDLPGNELECLIIVRLPFAPPNLPLNRAQMERAKAEGKNPFTDLALPQAVIRFKQGFGRLIRTKGDRGLIFVFDRRIVTTRYGRTFIDSLPEVPVHEGKLERLLEDHLDFREEQS